jgi:hypothetical protein
MKLAIASSPMPVVLVRRKPRANETASLVKPIRVALNKLDYCVVWRNNCGEWRDAQGNVVVYGLAPGSADLVGMVQCATELGPRHFARFFALEVKRPSKVPTETQLRWLEFVRNMGGFASVVHSVEEALAAVERCRMGDSQ